MAFYRCSSGGGTLTETVLWTNPSPSSSFSNQTVTLSESYTNYKYVGVKYATGTGSSAPEATMILSTEDAAKTDSSGSNNGLKGSIGSRYQSNVYARIIGFMSNTSVEITAARQQGSTNSNNALIIPKTIIGIK